MDTSARKELLSRNVAGMTYRFSQKVSDRNRGIAKVFPAYGLADNRVTYQSAMKSQQVPEAQLYLEASNHDKLFCKQKFFMKDFMEVLLASNVNPNKR